MALKRIAFCILFCVSQVQSLNVDLAGSNLSSLPLSSIPTSVTSLILDNNVLTVVEFPDGYDILGSLRLKNNLLSEFPNLCSIKNSLVNLVLHTNRISDVNPQLMKCLQKMKSLNLGDNLLTSFPDVFMPRLETLKLFYNFFEGIPFIPDLGKTLNLLQIGNNPIKRLTRHSLDQLGALTLKMGWTPISTLPNLCHLKNSSALTVSATDAYNLTCDCHIRWLQLVSPLNPIVEVNSAPCFSPVEMVGVNFHSIRPESLQCLGRPVLKVHLS
ncbi:hypothetical protein CAPTEDRAFT_200351 [Capitella teleta]|uniref:LRRCT domain-containing protein n=1 Tax=Capitella teleta TaxID=283909 RepID=R7V1B2_CAPTE|nr:hypothetical protein CAPTEDRAFT_200351 [Capitella teleta]|eukprot:ELU09481.1 hypothetical protein CAPTEDRAFT_200351 [Capitella teleta]